MGLEIWRFDALWASAQTPQNTSIETQSISELPSRYETIKEAVIFNAISDVEETIHIWNSCR